MSEIDSDSGVFGQGLVFAHLTAWSKVMERRIWLSKRLKILLKRRATVSAFRWATSRGDKEALALHQGAT